ncbi:hypothetical protein CK203_006778 [Vitis vinifera]|uniref:Uncharacterized protein n=1 Tax=Vitis vinifera TaxID=29760 RepID=A0A438KBF0_VITVI|nr:hypothetical protein CK203_006778 [Vitis vinifera]
MRRVCLLRKLNKIPSSFQGTIQRGASVPSAGVVQGIPPFHQDSTSLHSSQYHPGADGMQHHKHAHVRAPAFPSIGDGTARLDEGRGEGTSDGPGCMGGVEHPARPFSPNYSLVIPGPERRGHLVDWVEKASFACLSKLFEIDARRGIQDAAHCAEPDGGVKEADAEKRRALLDNREKKKTKEPFGRLPDRNAAQPLLQKNSSEKEEAGEEWEGVKEPTPPKEFAPPPITHEAEVIIEEPVNPAPHSISSGSGHVAGLNHQYLLAAVARLAIWLRKLRPSTIRTPLLRMSMQLKPFATPMEEAGAESQSQPSDDPDRLALVLVKGPPSKRPRSARNLRSGLLGRLQDRQQEIEVSCSSAHDAHPEGAKWRWQLSSSRPGDGPDEVAPGETHPAVNVEAPNPEQESPSVASSGGILLMMRLAPPLALLATRTGEWSPWHGQSIRSFTDLLRTTDYMKAFAARHKDTEDQLRLRLGRLKPAYPPLGGE